MNLRGDQVEQIVGVLCSAFGRPGELDQFLRYHLDEALAEIPRGANLNQQLFELVRWAESYGKLPGLVEAVRKARPANDALQEALDAAIDPGWRFGLLIHNWAPVSYSMKIDSELDWTEHFDRGASRVPTPEQWNADLLPQLHEVREGFRKELKRRKLMDQAASVPVRNAVRFRGRCCLSTALAVGNTFPFTDGWRIEVEQQNGRWWSDAVPDGPETLIREELRDETARDLALVVSVTGDAWPQVRNFLEDGGAAVRAVLTAQPEGEVGAAPMVGGGHARQFAQVVKRYLGSAIGRHRAQRTHLFVYGPMGLAAFLGHYLSRVGTLQCYEPQNHSYAPSCVLHT